MKVSTIEFTAQLPKTIQIMETKAFFIKASIY